MAVFKCKMCGGTIEFEQGATVGVCQYCGTKQTLPKTNDDVIANLYNRANNLRLKGEFDRAEKVYEDIVNKDDSQAEAHWGIVLCKYGIEYVEDPETKKRIPTCHRASYEAIRSDADYQAAIDYADGTQQEIYEAEARAIDKIQKGILAIAKEEKPFDVFICYKETDENGKRTIDSAIANDIYYQLTQEGFKVFYAAITLEDKLGQEYEPYIFAALNSAKVMLVIGTKPEYFNAVWVKNEWSRYLKLIKNDRSRLLIPCYRDMDAYDLPDEFAHLQAQDMSKIGFINDVTRGIKKVIRKNSEKTIETAVVNSANAEIEPLLKRVSMFLEDGEWGRADEFCERVLNIDPENATAYLGKMMAELKVKEKKDLSESNFNFVKNHNYSKIERFADERLISELNEYAEIRSKKAYEFCLEKYKAAQSLSDYRVVLNLLKGIDSNHDARALIPEVEKIINEKEKREKDYAFATENFSKAQTVEDYKKLLDIFESMPGYLNADEYAKKCRKIWFELTNSGFLELVFKYKTDAVFYRIDGHMKAMRNVEQNKPYSFNLPVGKHRISIQDQSRETYFNIEREKKVTIEVQRGFLGMLQCVIV